MNPSVAWRACAAALALLFVTASCGYAPVHGGSASERFHVVLSTSKVPDAVASDDVLAGVREELARRGALASGDGYPRCEVEVLRADEASEGIARGEDGRGDARPESRGTRVALVARAWLVRAPGAGIERDTGDVRAADTVATAPDAASAMFRHSSAMRAAGRRLGRRLGARLLGYASASDE